MTKTPQRKKSTKDNAARKQAAGSPHKKTKEKKADDESEDLSKIVWDRIGPLVVNPLK